MCNFTVNIKVQPSCAHFFGQLEQISLINRLKQAERMLIMNRFLITPAKVLSLALSGALLLTGCASSGASSSTDTFSNASVTALERDSNIFVEQVENLSDDFWLGADISSLLSEEESAVIYYNEDGEQQDLIKTLKESGLNAVRIRVWNDPVDADGNSYGGGHNDLETAIALGKRATDYGMEVLIDFHYSDFWADPSKQMAPKAWADMTVKEKCSALYDYTVESLNALLDAGVNVTCVQVGNETTTGISGVTNWNYMVMLLDSGCKAVRQVSTDRGQDMRIALHFTNPEDSDQYLSFAKQLNSAHVDYDIFATSYYPYWHGTLENLTATLKEIADTYQKQVMVAEVSYAYTYDNGDTFANTISEDTSCDFPYSVSVQSQANCIRDVVNAVVQTGDAGVGVFYWEPAWIPVPGESYEEQLALWEEHGSGWASSYSAEYDPDDAGQWYGGSSWDNQALFDFTGHPLASLSVFRYLKDGATTTVRPDCAQTAEVTFRIGETVTLPETVEVLYNNGDVKNAPVTWIDADCEAMTNGGVAKYTVKGTVTVDDQTFDTSCKVSVLDLNYVDNYSFEEDDTSMWTLTDLSGTTDELYVIEKQADAITGSHSLHFYSTQAIEFKAEQTITGLAPGTYYLTMTIHGSGTNQDIYLYADTDGEYYTQSTEVDGWSSYHTPVIEKITTTNGTITIGAHVACGPGGWGNLDDFILAPVEE
jgi:arabinogalactan endo-1,4-beta-galactosidase